MAAKLELRINAWSGLFFGTALAFSVCDMRITLIPITKLALLCTALAGALLTFSNSASAFTIRDAGSDQSTSVNHLTGIAVRSDERANVWSLRPDYSRLQAGLTDRMNTAGSREIITIPTPGGIPGGGTGVPDGGTTAMLLGAALGVIGMAKRYIRI
jgi:hypothetical protein